MKIKVMAIETAGKKPVKGVKLRLENQASLDLPKGTEQLIEKALDFLPIEHQIGRAHV